MGYGANLKKILDEKGITIKDLSRKTGIAATTLYSIVQRDASVRYDSAIKIAGILDIPINAICKDNPYDNDDRTKCINQAQPINHGIAILTAPKVH